MQKGKRRGNFRKKREKPEFDQQIVDLSRVTRVTKGGKQLSFRACIIIGDRKGRVGYGVDKGSDVQIAVEKAVRKAKKALIRIPIMNETIPHRVEAKFKAGRVMFKPAPKGSGIIAGSVLRTILDLGGVPNVSAKMMGKTNNKITNVHAVFAALKKFKVKAQAPKLAPKKVTENKEKAPVKKTAEKKAEKKAPADKK